jgi:hypothetical protein
MIHGIENIVKSIPVLLNGYNIHVKAEKLDLLSRACALVPGGLRTSVDLGGVWRVNGAYTHHLATKLAMKKAIIVDTDFAAAALKRLEKHGAVHFIKGDFGDDGIVNDVGPVDVVVLFDVLLHQVAPDWDEIIRKYASITNCFIVYNQQYVRGGETIRLTDLPFEEYTACVPRLANGIYREVYDHADEPCPRYGKNWKDIHIIWQWGITDNDLRKVFDTAGFREIFYRNYGRFGNLRHFENHGFIFVKKTA